MTFNEPYHVMLLSLLFLIILAITAYKSRQIVLSGLIFGALKAVASYFFLLAETPLPHATAALLTGAQFSANALLGIGIAYLVVKHGSDWRYTFATTALCVLTFVTSMIEPGLAAA